MVRELNGKYLHECIEWDFMLIDESCCEIFCCGCYDDSEFKNIKKKYNDDLDKLNAEKEMGNSCTLTWFDGELPDDF